MLLDHIGYKEFQGRDQEWILEGLSLRRRNLLVGKNATGKSRCLNVIGVLAKLLAGQQPPALASADYDARFTHGRDRIRYRFRVEGAKVLEEVVSVNDADVLRRGDGGEGTILAEQLGTEIKFQTPQDDLAAVVRRDAIQHPFLQPLHDWGAAVRHYHFGTPLGKDRFALFVQGGAKPVAEADDRDAAEVVGVFVKALAECGKEAFEAAMLRDLARLDYPAEKLGVSEPISPRVGPGFPGKPVCLWIKEKGLRSVTEQFVMSQGMFRVLSLLVLANYLTMAKRAGCVIIDDVGEGLDFDRACLLIDVLREKAEDSGLQLVAATNDKFVMNRVPLQEWSVLRRSGGRVSALDSENSRELFDEFRFTGLSNFSFLEMDFASGPPAEEAVAHE